MARPIDADKLLGIYKKWIPQLSSKEDEGDRRGVETCIAVLEDMPTMDAVEVVRCKDCKYHHWEQEPCHGKIEHYCELPHMRGVEIFEEFFCYYGKEKGYSDNG